MRYYTSILWITKLRIRPREILAYIQSLVNLHYFIGWGILCYKLNLSTIFDREVCYITRCFHMFLFLSSQSMLAINKPWESSREALNHFIVQPFLSFSLLLCLLLTCVPTSINMRLGIVPQDCSFYNTHPQDTHTHTHRVRTHESSFNLLALSHLWKQSHFGTPNKRCQFNLVLVPAGHMGHLKPLGTGTGYKGHKAACQTEHRKWLPCRPSCCVRVCKVLGVCVCVCVWGWRQQVTSGIVKLKMA